MLAANITGIKYSTVNPIGFSPGDAPLGGVTINLFQDNGDGVFNPMIDPLLAQQVTAPGTGAYTFANVADGRYFINEVVPTGYVQSAGLPFYTVDVIDMVVYSGNTTVIDSFSTPAPVATWQINSINADPFEVHSTPAPAFLAASAICKSTCWALPILFPPTVSSARRQLISTSSASARPRVALAR